MAAPTGTGTAAWPGCPHGDLGSRLARARPPDLPSPHSLFMWVQPEITQKLYVALWAAFLASCFFPYRLVGLAVGKERWAQVGGWVRVPRRGDLLGRG